ncbi:hypothetical protein LCGC14_1921470 [marine sediment metagenome]|uniref:Uncharacterized protein n=1 Tax=marine sediment metagenome TaxID=412755 RepID=A0A0F9FQI1_9ZZZZ
MKSKKDTGNGLSRFVRRGATPLKLMFALGKPRCEKCGYRIRGTVTNHRRGTHHAKGRTPVVPKKKR